MISSTGAFSCHHIIQLIFDIIIFILLISYSIYLFISTTKSNDFNFVDINSNLSKAKAFSIITILLFAGVTVLNVLYGYRKNRF